MRYLTIFEKMMASNMKTYSISKSVLTKSCVSLALLVLIAVVLGATANSSRLSTSSLHVFLMLSLGLLVLILIVLFVANLFLVAISPKRKSHLAMLVLMPAVTISTYQLCHKWENYGHHSWFLNSALPEYQAAVDIILRDPSIITNQERLQVLVGHPTGCSYVHGEIKPDGLVAIYFSGADHWSAGHAYFSGDQTNFEGYRYLTNHWYEH
jgi:hypothetical protein